MGFRVSSLRFTKDSYDSLRVQLEESIAANLEAMGSMVSKVGFPQVEMRKPLKGLTHGETPENLSAPGVEMEMEKTIGHHWPKKKHHFPDSIQIQLWGCKLFC